MFSNGERRDAPNGYLNPDNPDHIIDDTKAIVFAEQALALHSLNVYANDREHAGDSKKTRRGKSQAAKILNNQRGSLIVDVLLSDGYGRTPNHVDIDATKIYEHILEINGEKPDPTLKRHQTLPLKSWRGLDSEGDATWIFKAIIQFDRLGITPYLNRIFVRKLAAVTFIDGVVCDELTRGIDGDLRYPAYYFTYDKETAVPGPESHTINVVNE
jgi:hypothetical protein